MVCVSVYGNPYIYILFARQDNIFQSAEFGLLTYKELFPIITADKPTLRFAYIHIYTYFKTIEFYWKKIDYTSEIKSPRKTFRYTNLRKFVENQSKTDNKHESCDSKLVITSKKLLTKNRQQTMFNYYVDDNRMVFVIYMQSWQVNYSLRNLLSQAVVSTNIH